MHTHTFKMYHVLSRDFGVGLLGVKKTTRFYEREFTIPRCESCYKIHKNANTPALGFALAGATVSFVLGWYFGERWYVGLTAFAVGFLTILLLYYQFIYRQQLKRLQIKDQYEIHDHPLVLEAKKDGWQLTKI